MRGMAWSFQATSCVGNKTTYCTPEIKSILFFQLARKLKASFPPTPPVRTRKSSQATAAGLAQSKHELDASSREEAIPT
jgi:hypothetical protein